jgi:cytochrome c-type biogenesis protein CcmH/NrfF
MSRASARSALAALAASLVTTLAAAQTAPSAARAVARPQAAGQQAPAAQPAPRAPSSRLPAAEMAVSPGPPPQTPARPPDSSSRGRLWAPEMAGRSQARVIARGDDSLVKALESKLRCTCGCNLDVFTCRTTDFTCTTSPAMHRVVLARLDSGMTADQVLASFEKQYGEVVLMQPPKRGFNLAAYFMPFVGLLAGLLIVALVIRGWFRARPKTPLEGAAAVEGAAPAATDDDLKRLQQELEKFEA